MLQPWHTQTVAHITIIEQGEEGIYLALPYTAVAHTDSSTHYSYRTGGGSYILNTAAMNAIIICLRTKIFFGP